MAEKFAMENEYTLSVTRDVAAGGRLTREFNFASNQLTTIYARKEEKAHSLGEYSTGKATSVAVALASQMDVRNFSELDSQVEVELMREKLISLGGKPPAADAKQKIAPAKLSQ